MTSSEHSSRSMNKDVEQSSDADSASKPPLPSPKPPLPGFLWNIVILMGVGVYSSYTILVHLCEEKGKIPFSTGALNFCIELMKLSLSLSMFYCTERLETNSRTAASCLRIPKFSARTVASFSVPAVLYCINNNLAVYIQLEMDPATYQILGNMKILTTSVLFRIIMKRKIPRLQWIALGLLLMSGVANSVGGLFSNRGSAKLKGANSSLHITLLGLIMITFYCFVSGLAGVYTEYVLKKQMEINLHLQNSLLYIFGVGLNTFTFIGQNASSAGGLHHPFHGFSAYTWAIVITQAVGGIIMGAVMKYANNITRLFIISSAVVVTTVASVLIFDLQLNLWFACSFLLVFTSLVLYHTPPPASSSPASSPGKV